MNGPRPWPDPPRGGTRLRPSLGGPLVGSSRCLVFMMQRPPTVSGMGRHVRRTVSAAAATARAVPALRCAPPPPAYSNTCPCPSDQTCVNGTCCNNANVCGSVCCAACSTCQDGTCVSSCDSGKVCLSNGTCATPCASADGFCDGNRCGCGGCLCDRLLCGGARTDTPCSSDNDCPSGQFCDGICIGAC